MGKFPEALDKTFKAALQKSTNKRGLDIRGDAGSGRVLRDEGSREGPVARLTATRSVARSWRCAVASTCCP
jgi:hypothetical protein